MVRAGRRAGVAGLVVALVLLAGCSGSSAGGSGPGPAPAGSATASAPADVPATSAAPALPGVPAALTDPYSCRGGFICAGLPVPIDRSDPSSPTVTLQVAVEADPSAPRGVLVALNGGPGAAGAPIAGDLAERFGPEVMAAYRVVALDQRGTGTTALSCPALQAETGTRFTPSAAAVRACARTLGARRGHFGTDATVADLDRLREVLGADRLTLFAMSYGTFVAQQYAVAHPARTAALVLDSPFPAGGADPLQLDEVRATPRVLRLACRAARCPGDPVADLAAVVRHGDAAQGADLLALLSAMSAVRPGYDTLLPALRQAARGDRAELDRLLQAYRTGLGTTPEVFSAGLNVAASCGDQRFPWGRSGAPVGGREAAVDRAVGRAGRLYPFDAPSVRAGAGVAGCLPWPPVAPSRVSLGRPALPDVPVLFLAGDRDLAAPVEPLRAAAARAPQGRLVVVRGAGHVVTARPGRGRRVVREALLGGSASP